MSNNLQSLQEWHKLFQDGIISETEYENKKREILGLPKIQSVIEKKQEIPVFDQNAEVVQNTQIATAQISKPKPAPVSKKSFSGTQISVVVGLALLLLGTAGYFFLLKPYLDDKNAEKYYSFVDNLAMRSSPVAGVDFSAIQALGYGSEVLVYSKENNWASGKSRDQKGFVSMDYILPKKDFYELNGIFGDQETKAGVPTAKCRLALLRYFQDSTKRQIMGKIDPEIQKQIYGKVKNNQVWQVFSKGKDKYPDAVFFPRFSNSTSKYSDFACLIKNISTGERKFLLFAFSDSGEPQLINEQTAPITGDISKISETYEMGERIPLVSYTSQ